MVVRQQLEEQEQEEELKTEKADLNGVVIVPVCVSNVFGFKVFSLTSL